MITKMVNGIESQGLTVEQLYSISVQDGYVSSKQKDMIKNVIYNFKKIDVNNDGKVSQAEMNKYLLNKDIDDLKAEMYDLKASRLTNFYGDSTSADSGTDAEDTSSYSTEQV
jgi:Ca2+-binding EF-hand superfamily protein